MTKAEDKKVKDEINQIVEIHCKTLSDVSHFLGQYAGGELTKEETKTYVDSLDEQSAETLLGNLIVDYGKPETKVEPPKKEMAVKPEKEPGPKKEIEKKPAEKPRVLPKTKLRAKKPEMKENQRIKLFLYGESGVGKTLSALQFPNAYYIDTEKGGVNYNDTLLKANSVVLQTSNPDEIKQELKELLTAKHNYRTLIIDPITQVYNTTQSKWSQIFEKYAKSEKDKDVQDFGMRYWQRVKKDFKELQRLIFQLDMNVIITAHQKDIYGSNFSKIGTTYDSMKGDAYIFDYIFQLTQKGDKRIAITIKERAELDKQKFPPVFEWSYENFLKFYGTNIIEKESIPVLLATNEQVLKVSELVKIVKINNETINKWMLKAEVNDWSEMTGEQIEKCIKFIQAKLNSLI